MADFRCDFQLRIVHGYLMVTSDYPEMKISLGTAGKASMADIGRGVLQIFNQALTLPMKPKKKENKTKLVKISEASQELGICPQTIRNMIVRNKLKIKTTPGGHRRLDLEELKRFLK